MPISAPPPRQFATGKYTPSPDAAGMLSFLFPGLGQMWSGEKRKGTLFMLAHLINLSAMFNIICAPFILENLVEFGRRYHMKLNVELSDSFQHLGPGSPFSIILMLLLLSFSLFAARDAFDQSTRRKRQAIYHDYVVAMPEATSGSYIFHVSFLLACLLLAFFVLIPPLPRAQVTVIEFGQSEQNTKEKVLTNRHAQNNARAAGHNDPRKLTELSASGGSSQPKAAPREVKPAPVKTTALARDSRPPLPDFAPRPLPPVQSPVAPAAPTPLQLAARPMPPVPASPRAVAAPAPMPVSNLTLPAPAPTSIRGLHVAPVS
ncbi:MAG: hypothetical protein JSS83_25530, partial [Cyanobacteria bacterium SZAS LIN-3]|nr:hypothetical protein [Cyanobacteria bacterium SZAS LIN-3]